MPAKDEALVDLVVDLAIDEKFRELFSVKADQEVIMKARKLSPAAIEAVKAAKGGTLEKLMRNIQVARPPKAKAATKSAKARAKK